jgi:hypothetical protein
MSEIRNKPIILLSFDGVVRTSEESVTEGFFEWAAEANKQFALMIHSPRSNTEEGIAEMKNWLQTHIIAWRHDRMERNSGNATALFEFQFPSERPAAFLTIDDRTIPFTGRWGDPRLSPDALVKFIPWHDAEYVRAPEDEERPSNVAPPPNRTNICPRHPWMTFQEPSGKRRCTHAGCTWVG